MMGCGFPDGEQGYNIGRNAVLLAGIDHHVPAVTVSRFCASSLQTIRMAFHAIKAGEGEQYIAAGVECVSRGAAMTFPLMNPRIDGTNGTGYNVYISMGITAENVAERCKVSRESQDEWAALSQQRAVAARDSGHFDREIVGVDIPETHDAGGDVVAAHTVTRDDGPRPGTTVEKLSQAQARVQARWLGHRGQRVPAQRRRRGGAGDVARSGRASWASSRGRGSSRPRWRRFARRSWASARSRRSGRYSRRPA